MVTLKQGWNSCSGSAFCSTQSSLLHGKCLRKTCGPLEWLGIELGSQPANKHDALHCVHFFFFFFLTFYKISCIYFYQRKWFWRILDWYSFVIILHFVHFHVCSIFMWVLPWCSLTRFAERKAAVQPTGFSADEEDAESTNSDKEGHENNRSYGQTYESTDTAKGEKRKRWINEQRIDDEEVRQLNCQ